ncbi:MAG: SDR family oxidoreductase, partial [Alphaproteobacteria bacterium]|nr:SDR family oxidoreductase [Alphaproteobacteria bacterium]
MSEMQTLILTGASRGIGHATAIKFKDAGWRVITCSRQSFPGGICPWGAGPEDHIEVDLSDPEGLAVTIEEMRKRLTDGRVHALVNNAAVSPKDDDGGRLGVRNTRLSAWHHVMQVNFYAPLMLARGLAKELAAGKGSVVNVTSIAGGRVHRFAGPAYATSK